MTLQPTQIHDDGVGTAGRRPAKPHIPDSIGNAEKKYGKQFCEVTGEKQGKSPKHSLSRNSSHKTRKTSQKPPQKQHGDYPTIYRMCMQYSACSRGKPPVLITASAELHRRSGRCHQKTTVIIKTNCKT